VAQSFYYVRADEMIYGATVTTTAGATDSDYNDDWICSGWPGTPARATTGTVTWDATFSAKEISLVAACHCNSDVNATIGGGASATITAGALQPDGTRLNGFATFTPASITNLTIAFSGAAEDVILGEFVAGKKRTLTLPKLSDDDRSEADFTRPIEMDATSIAPYDIGLSGRGPWSGTFALTTTELNNMIACFRAQRNGTRPTLIVPNTSVNDAWLGFFAAPKYKPIGPAFWRVQLVFREIPRLRWP